MQFSLPLGYIFSKQFFKDFFSFKYLRAKELLMYLGIFLIFVINTSYIMYSDEFVNILGGKFILNGGLPYKDFFDHHLPLPWILASFFLLIALGKFVIFRFWWAVFQFGILAAVGIWIRNNYRQLYPYYLLFFLLYPLLSVYFWFHLYLGDSFAALFFSAIFWILIAQSITRKTDYKAILWSSFLTFCLIFSSLTYSYLALIFYAWQLYLIGMDKMRLLRYIALTVTPYILYLIFTLMSGTFSDFWFSNFIYNTKLYISIDNYTRGEHFNPLKFALTLMYNFFSGYVPLLTTIKEFDLYNIIGALIGLGTFSLLVLLFFRNPLLGILYFFILSFSAPRSHLDKFSEMDYQVSVFLVLGVASSLLAMALLLKQRIGENLINDLKRVTFFLLFVFFLFNFLFLAKNTYVKFFLRYTQKMPSIADVSFTANTLNALLKKGEYFWVGPYEPIDEFFVKDARLPGKYTSLLPQYRENDYMRKTFIQQFEKHSPKIIVFKQDSVIFSTKSTDFGKFFLDWMKGKYVRVGDIPNVEVTYNTYNTFDMAKDMYIRKSDQKEMLKRLLQQGDIKIKEKTPTQTTESASQ